MSANEVQHGGAHYHTDYQHWDFVEDHGLGYLEGNATKYVARHRRKSGVEDLRKGRHYVEKLLELHLARGRPPRGAADVAACERFGKANGLNAAERTLVTCIATWANERHLRVALSLFDQLIELIEES